MVCGVQAETRPPVPADSFLAVVVRDANGVPVQGNVFPTLTHSQSGQVWRQIHYSKNASAFVYRGLSSGNYTLRIAAARMRAFETAFELDGHQRKTIDVHLVHPVGQNLLILRLDGELDQLVRSAEDVNLPSHTYGHTPAVRLLRSLCSDNQVLRALEEPLDSLECVPRFELHFARRLASLGFPYRNRRTSVQRLFWSLVDSRCGLAAIISAVFQNLTVAQYVGISASENIELAAIRAVDILDALDVCDALYMLASVLQPWRAVVEEVARSQTGPKGTAIPAGIARQMRKTPNAPSPARLFPRGRWNGAKTDQTCESSGPRLVEIVQVLVGATESPRAPWRF